MVVCSQLLKENSSFLRYSSVDLAMAFCMWEFLLWATPNLLPWASTLRTTLPLIRSLPCQLMVCTHCWNETIYYNNRSIYSCYWQQPWSRRKHLRKLTGYHLLLSCACAFCCSGYVQACVHIFCVHLPTSMAAHCLIPQKFGHRSLPSDGLFPGISLSNWSHDMC